MKQYEATVQIYVEAESDTDAAALIEKALDPTVFDWEYREPVTENIEDANE